MAEWIECTLGDLVTFQRGHDLPKSQMQEGQYPVVGSNGIIGFHNEYTTDNPSITVGRSGNVGKPFIYYGKTWSHNTTLYVKDYKGNDPVFVFYFLKTMDLANYAGGSAVPTLNRNHIHTLPVLIPKNVEIQRKIGTFLKQFDDKIEENERINNNLEQQSFAIFDDAYSRSKNTCPFTSLINVLGGGTPKTGEETYWNGAIPFFTPKDVGFPYCFSTEKTITENGLAHCNSKLYPKGTTFVTARGTVGKVSLAGVPMAMNQSCYALASDTLDPLLVYFYTLKTVASLKHKASGAVFDAIITRDFDTETISVLESDVTERILACIKPLMERIHLNTRESIRLTAIRDALLPKLMSGELDVSDIDL